MSKYEIIELLDGENSIVVHMVTALVQRGVTFDDELLSLMSVWAATWCKIGQELEINLSDNQQRALAGLVAEAIRVRFYKEEREQDIRVGSEPRSAGDSAEGEEPGQNSN